MGGGGSMVVNLHHCPPDDVKILKVIVVGKKAVTFVNLIFSSPLPPLSSPFSSFPPLYRSPRGESL